MAPVDEARGRGILRRSLIADIADAIRADGFFFLDPAQTEALLADDALAGWQAFAGGWDDLATDRFMADGGRYRRRRHAVFRVSRGVSARLENRPHFQTTAFNPLNGGVDRWFAPVTEPIENNPVTRAVLTGFGAIIDTVQAPRADDGWFVEMHQFRIEAQAARQGLPTPEGIHQDGAAFVLMLMVNRKDVDGAATLIETPEGRTIVEKTLRVPLEAVVLDDRRVRHGASPLSVQPPALVGHRDVLVMTARGLLDR